jgi:hypothetical protein
VANGYTPKALVEGAPRQPLPYGLFSVLAPRPEGDGRWMNGMEWQTLTCEPVSGRSGPGCDDVADENGDYPEGVVGLPKALDRNGGGVDDAAAFAVYGHFNCSPVGWTPEAAQERATAHLLAREEARVEQALWTGDLGNTPNLQGAVDLTSGGPVSPAAAAALLEDWIATEYGSLGVLHGTRGAALLLARDYVLEQSSSRLTTTVGTPMVAGAGYPNTGPDGAPAAAGTWWLYVTPRLFGYRSDILTSSATPGDLLDRSTNDLYSVAERGYALGWDPCGVAAAQITLT